MIPSIGLYSPDARHYLSKRYSVHITLFIIFVFLFAPLKIYGYLDPGTGSYMLQILLATLIGAAYAVKVYWRKIKAYFKNIISGKESEG